MLIKFTPRPQYPRDGNLSNTPQIGCWVALSGCLDLWRRKNWGWPWFVIRHFPSETGCRLLQSSDKHLHTQGTRFDPRSVCDGQTGSGRGFAASASVFPCQCHSTNAPYLERRWKHMQSPNGWARPLQEPYWNFTHVCVCTSCWFSRMFLCGTSRHSVATLKFGSEYCYTN
jgi:hypothetical protein